MTEELQRQLAELQFRRSADSAFEKTAASGNLAGFQKAFTKSISKVRKAFRKRFADFSAKQSSGLHWANPIDQELANNLNVQQDGQQVDSFLHSQSPLTPLQTIVAAEWLLRFSADANPEDFVQIFLQLASFQAGHQDWGSDNAESHALEALTATAEAPLVVGLLLGMLKSSKTLARTGQDNLAKILTVTTDTDGMLHGSLAAFSFEYTAPIIRSLGWAQAFDETLFEGRMLKRWQQILSQSIAMRDQSGCVLSSNAVPTPDQQCHFLLVGCDLSELSKKSEVVQCLVGQTKKTAAKTRRKPKESKQSVAAGSSQSDWTATAVLRSSLHRDADLIGLSWNEAIVALGISSAGQRLLTGDWKFNIAVDGVQHQPVGNWVCTCWFHDEDVAFVELEQGAADGTRHVRHVVLLLTDNVAILTDTVTCSNADTKVEFSSRLTGVSARIGSLQGNPITRELRGGEQAPELRIIPTWLEDDRLIKAMGECTFLDGDLHLTAHGHGGIMAPLVLDWNPERMASEADWTRLTVTEDRERVSPRDAAGMRVRIGRLQLLMYRSLRPGKTLRAVLGHNTANETIYGRVLNSGFIDPLVLVEAES